LLCRWQNSKLGQNKKEKNIAEFWNIVHGQWVPIIGTKIENIKEREKERERERERERDRSAQWKAINDWVSLEHGTSFVIYFCSSNCTLESNQKQDNRCVIMCPNNYE
jgi:hypothetical protein